MQPKYKFLLLIVALNLAYFGFVVYFATQFPRNQTAPAWFTNPLLVCGEFASHQARGQYTAENQIEHQTETRPPVRYAGIFKEKMMNEIKDSVPNEGNGY